MGKGSWKRPLSKKFDDNFNKAFGKKANIEVIRWTTIIEQVEEIPVDMLSEEILKGVNELKEEMDCCESPDPTPYIVQAYGSDPAIQAMCENCKATGIYNKHEEVKDEGR